LPINLFNEKIFLIIWFWLYFTTLFTLFGFLYWSSSFFYPQFYKSRITRYLSSMKRINTHHFPQNPYQEQHHQSFRRPYHFYHHNSHHHHHSSYHRRHSFAHAHYSAGGGSHYGSIHGGHPHHSILSSFASRTLKPHLELVRLSRVREQLSPPTATENNEPNAPSSNDDQTPPSPSTPQPSRPHAQHSFSISVEDDRLLSQFLTNYLGRDGILVLYILQMNTNEVITGEIVTALYEMFKTTARTGTTE
jgi:hypothetical protein